MLFSTIKPARKKLQSEHQRAEIATMRRLAAVIAAAACLSSAYVPLPLRSAHRLPSLRRRAAPVKQAAVSGAPNATEYGVGLVRNGKAYSDIAPNFASSLTFSTPDPVATPRQRQWLLRQRVKPRSAASSRAVRRRRALEREQTIERDFDFIEASQFLSLVVPPIVAFVTWPMVADAIATLLNGQNAAQPVDGNLFAVQLLRPTVNGVVLPTLSVSLGTLLATTINVLRNRQVDIRAALNKEACELRLLRAALLGAYGTAQHGGRRAEALDLVRAYSARIVAESSPGAFEAIRKEERSGGVGVNELEPLAKMMHGVDGAYAARQGSVQACLQLVNDLNTHRSERLAALLGGFPPIHWFVLSQLAISILLAFLIESNQEVLQFLNSLQLRFLFALIVAVCSGTATLCLDLTDPFRGRFSVVTATSQIVRLEDLLVDDVDAAERLVDDAQTQGILDAVFFHIFTSGFAAPVRAVGDVVSYAARPISRMRRRRSAAEDS